MASPSESVNILYFFSEISFSMPSATSGSSAMQSIHMVLC